MPQPHVSWRPGTMLYPLPAVLVSCCGHNPSSCNLITVAWTGILCSEPPMTYISVRPERHSHGLLMETMEFTICLTTAAMARATDWCGVRSGRDNDKWAASGLTPMPGVAIRCPYAAESPVALECKIKEVVHLGSHDMMVADIVNVLADPSLLDPDTGALDLERADLMSYIHGHYYGQGPELGHFGFSVRKKRP